MYSSLLVTTLIIVADAAAQAPPVQDRLVPIPQPGPQVRKADEPLSVEAQHSDAVV